MKKLISLLTLVLTVSACSFFNCYITEKPSKFTREDSAPIKLEYVDFRIRKGKTFENWGTKLGQYRFRMFGCRRDSQEITLNSGRVMRKDMKFFEAFFETLNDNYKIVLPKTNKFYEYSDQYEIPEYILTAEITDYFMNVCDGYDWKKTKKTNLRKGTSEITVTWRLLDIAKKNIYWKAETKGYGIVDDPVEFGETELVEKAFADALQKIQYIDSFNQALMVRVPEAEIIKQQKDVKNAKINADDFRAKYEASVIEKQIITEEKTPEEKIIIEAKKADIPLSEEVEKLNTKSAIPLTTESNLKTAKAEIPLDEEKLTKEQVEEKIASNKTKTPWIPIPLISPDNKENKTIRKNMESSFAESTGNLYIENILPYDVLSAAKLYKVRSSVVSVANSYGESGGGLIISPRFILTSAGLITPEKNILNVKTINGRKFKASAFRVNPNKNVALIVLDNDSKYKPVPLSVNLPDVGTKLFITLGTPTDETGEGYIDTDGYVKGYRYSEEKGAEILVHTKATKKSLGGVLIDQNGNVMGVAHSLEKTDEDNTDLFIPIATALQSLDIKIRDKDFSTYEPEALIKIKNK